MKSLFFYEVHSVPTPRILNQWIFNYNSDSTLHTPVFPLTTFVGVLMLDEHSPLPTLTVQKAGPIRAETTLRERVFTDRGNPSDVTAT